MTLPQAEGADRISGAAKSLLRPNTAVTGLAILLLVGLLIRLTLAYVLLPRSGFESDLSTFTSWALTLAERGPGSFYATTTFADYPPGYLYVLWLIGGLGNFLAPLANSDAASATAALIKLPAIFADVLVGLILYWVVKSWRAAHVDAHRVALIAAAIYLLNPVTWYDSAIWGQTDAFGALIALVTVAALVRGNSEGAAALAVLAALIKPQFGIVLLPIVGIILLRRHLLRPGSGPRNAVLAPAGLRTWFETEQGTWRLVSSAVVSLVVLLLLITPFSLDIFGFLGQMQKTAGGYPYLTVNAYSAWALVGADGRGPFAFGGGWSEDTVPLLGPLPGVVIGGALLALGFALGVARGVWRDDRRTVVIVTTFLALAFFMLPTRVHERYMFPIFGLLPLLAVVDRRWLWATVALSAGAFINFHGVLTQELYATPNLEQLPFGDLFREPIGIIASIGLNIAGFAFICWQMRPAAAEEPDPYEVPARARRRPLASPDMVALERTTAAASLTAAAVPDAVGTEIELGADLDAEPVPDSIFTRARRWLGGVIGDTSIRRDRSGLLVGESGGRLDRRDLLLILLVFVASMLLRTYRLEVPYSMHFDEVYHARTATEFLQDWRYDMPHSIYEFTHPHMAKYLMAFGIVTLGNNRVTDVRELGTSVKSAAVEERWAPEPGDQRNGDRLYVVSDTEVRAYDLATRAHVATIAGSFDSVAVDQGAHVVYVATAAGAISKIDTTQIDGHAAAAPLQLATQAVIQLSGLDGELSRLTVTGKRLVALSSGTVIGVDLFTGLETGRVTYPDPTAVAGVTARNVVIVDPAAVTDQVALAETLSGLIDRDSDGILRAMENATLPVPVAGFISKSAATELREEIEAGELPGVSLEEGTGLVIGLSTGVVMIDVDTFRELAFFGTFEPVSDLTLARSGPEHPTIFAAAGDTVVTLALPSDDSPRIKDTIEMPAAVEQVFWNEATTMVHVLGRTQDGTAPTVYVIEPRSDPPAVFADARLDTEPQAVVLDVQSDRPAEDRNDLLALDSTGQIATVDIGNNQFAYRFPGVLLGALMAVCIYVLARFLFNRRGIAVMVSLIVLADGMFFANERIAMNDVYVAFFIVAAFTLFVPLWLGRWRSRPQIAVGLLGVGVLLGLALASKWVGAYAIGGLGLLILLRSALGRLIALAAMVGMTAFLGYIAVTPNPDVVNPQVNIPFLALMVGLTTLLAVAMAIRPVRMTHEELRLAVLAPLVPGLGLSAVGVYGMLSESTPAVGQTFTPSRLILFGGVLIAVGVACLIVGWLAARYGHGPLAQPSSADPDREPAAPPPPRGWLRPGSGFLGLPWLLGLAAITVIPLAVYMASYLPWIDLGNQWFAGFPAGNSGQTFLDLQKSMYDYHNLLRATHAASSPWWAWPFDLKPVWFEQRGYAGETTAVIYDTGNLVAFWLAIPAVLWTAYMAWKRRSLPLTFVMIAIASLWLPWARIDRATFQYHIFTTLPFSFMALAYFLAELWHGPSKRTWAFARAAAALAVIGAPLLWLLRLPLCSIARTENVNAGTEVCAALSRQLVLTDVQAIGLLIALLALVAAGIAFFTRAPAADAMSTWRPLLLPVCFSIALFGVVIVVVGAGLGGASVFQAQVQAEWPALAALVLLMIPAYFVLRASDPRRFVVGALAAAVIWFIAFYPNIASLPVPTPLSQIHLGLLPTWNWGFQFGVNLDEANRASPNLAIVSLLAAATVALCVAAVYAARSWRTQRIEDSAVSPLPEAG